MPKSGTGAMPKNTFKTLVAVTLTIIFIVLAYMYWLNNNACEYFKNISNHLAELVNVSTTKNFDSTEFFVIRQELRNEYVKELRPLNDKLFTAWKTAGKLSPAQAGDFRKEITAKEKELAHRNATLKNNQLLSTFIILLIFGVFLWLVLYTNILRDIISKDSQVNVERLAAAARGEQPSDFDPPYSLSRTQLATWIAIIASIYTYSVLWDSHLITINNTALILMGISVGTYAVGAMVDVTEISRDVSRHQDIRASAGFFQDILSDENGISIHRFQMLVWTVVAIVVYFYKYGNPGPNTTGLPDLDNTLLALTGISSAAYLTLKTRENATDGKKILDTLDITLQPEGLTGPENAAIANSTEGLRKAVVTLSTTVPGEATHAAPKSPDSKFNFVAKQVEIGKYYKFTAVWEDTVTGAPAKLQGVLDTTIAEDMKLVTIKMKKP